MFQKILSSVALTLGLGLSVNGIAIGEEVNEEMPSLIVVNVPTDDSGQELDDQATLRVYNMDLPMDSNGGVDWSTVEATLENGDVDFEEYPLNEYDIGESQDIPEGVMKDWEKSLKPKQDNQRGLLQNFALLNTNQSLNWRIYTPYGSIGNNRGIYGYGAYRPYGNNYYRGYGYGYGSNYYPRYGYYNGRSYYPYSPAYRYPRSYRGNNQYYYYRGRRW